MAGEDEQKLTAALQDHARSVADLLAENFALQALLLRIAAATQERPDLRLFVLEAFEDAAAFVRQTYLKRDGLLEALEVIDRMRIAFEGPEKPSPRPATRP